MFALEAIKLFVPTIVSFTIGILFAPTLISVLISKKVWKKKNVSQALSGDAAPITSMLHNDEVKKLPRMGGIVVWMSVFTTSFIFWILGNADFGVPELDFVSRSQTWLPLATMAVGAIIGFFDDYLVVKTSGSYVGGGLSLRKRILFVAILGIVVGYWFNTKLDLNSLYVPFFGNIYLGVGMIFVFSLVMVALFSGGVIDGIDGLSGTVMTSIFAAYGIIAVLNNQIDIATFCFVTVGAIFAFLWYNIPPAKFMLSETGMLALTTALTVVAFLTNSVVLLGVIALPLFVTSASSLIQILSKKYRGGKKVFTVAPLHNHFLANGMAGHTVVMRYSIVSFICALTGVILHIIS